MRLLTALLALAVPAASFVASAKYHEPYEGSRIFWDVNSKKTLFPSGNYARIIHLDDGRLMAVAEAGGGISVSYSSNNGDGWTSPELIVRRRHNPGRIQPTPVATFQRRPSFRNPHHAQHR